jgi:hypothetical protein
LKKKYSVHCEGVQGQRLQHSRSSSVSVDGLDPDTEYACFGAVHYSAHNLSANRSRFFESSFRPKRIQKKIFLEFLAKSVKKAVT